jgi:hypothetical protein
MGTPHDPVAAERSRLANLIGTRENAEPLFVPKVSDDDARNSGLLVLQRLDFVTGTNALYSRFQVLTDAQIAEWGPRIWANTVSHLAASDPEVRAILLEHHSSMPEAEGARVFLMQKVYNAFVFFLWIIASPSRPSDPQNCCILKLIILQDAILLENINAVRNGTAGGWGWLDKAIAGTREIGEAFEIRRIKAVATNERVYRAFLARGFHDAPQVPGLEFHVIVYARHVELTW